MNIFEVLEYGPIVAQNEESGYLITANGAYLNFWVAEDTNRYTNTDCRSFNFEGNKCIMDLTLSEVMGRAEAWIEEVLSESNEE